MGCCGGAWNAIERVMGYVSCWSIKEEGISIGVGYRVLEGFIQSLVVGQRHPLRADFSETVMLAVFSS